MLTRLFGRWLLDAWYRHRRKKRLEVRTWRSVARVVIILFSRILPLAIIYVYKVFSE
jgi:hypothetical protein